MENNLREEQDIKSDMDEIQRDFELTTLGTIGAGAMTAFGVCAEYVTGSELASMTATSFGALSVLGISRMVYDEVRLSGLRRRMSSFGS